MLQIKHKDGRTWLVNADGLSTFLQSNSIHGFQFGYIAIDSLGGIQLHYYTNKDTHEYAFPFKLDPAEYTISDTESIPRAEVLKVLRERRDEHNKTAEQMQHETLRTAEIAFALEDESIASALNLSLTDTQEGANTDEKNTVS